MTEFSIYQINTDRDNNRVCFLGLDSLERFQHSKEVDPALYDRVYDGKLDCNSLETIYEKFNIDHPADYKGRSLSVSDVVEIRESDTLNPGFYFVDSIGFKSISFDKSLCKEPVKASDGKISVLLVEPNKYPKMIEIDDTLEAMQAVVGGDIEESKRLRKQKGSTSALKPFASGSARTASATAFFFKISECQVKSLRLLCRPGCFVKEVSMISTSSNKIDEIVVPDEIETYVSMPSCLLQGCSNNLIIFRADGGNHFTHYGIYEGMFLIFDVSKDFKDGRLSCYLNNSGDDRPKFKVSDKPLDGYRHLGRLVASMKNYEV